MNIEYGVAGISDLDIVVDYKIEMFREAGRSSLLHENAREIIMADYSALYESGAACHVLAKEAKKIIAVAGAFIKSDLPYRYFKQPEYGFIGDVYTLPAYRGSGISTELNKQLLEWLRQKGIRAVRLLASEQGRPIYARLGFSPTDEMALQL